MPRAAVEIDDKDRSTKGFGAAQQANSRIMAEIIEDQALLPLLAVLGDHQAAAGHDWTGTDATGKAASAAAKRVNASRPPSLKM